MLVRIWRKFALVLLVIWCVLLVMVGAKFAQNNPELITLDLILWQLPPLSSGLLVSITLLAGVFLGALMFFPLVVISRTRIRRLRSQLMKAQHPISQPAPVLRPVP